MREVKASALASLRRGPGACWQIGRGFEGRERGGWLSFGLCNRRNRAATFGMIKAALGLLWEEARS